MNELRMGRQTPTQSVVLPYSELNRIFSSIKTKLSGQYEQEDINGNMCFKNKNGMYFTKIHSPK